MIAGLDQRSRDAPNSLVLWIEKWPSAPPAAVPHDSSISAGRAVLALGRVAEQAGEPRCSSDTAASSVPASSCSRVDLDAWIEVVERLPRLALQRRMTQPQRIAVLGPRRPSQRERYQRRQQRGAAVYTAIDRASPDHHGSAIKQGVAKQAAGRREPMAHRIGRSVPL